MHSDASAAYPDPAMGIEVKLDPDPKSVRAARAFVATNLRALGFPASVDNGVLIVSEMAANALKAAADTPF